MKVRATREQLEEWLRYKAGELSIDQVSDGTLVLMVHALAPGDVIVTQTGEHPIPAKVEA